MQTPQKLLWSQPAHNNKPCCRSHHRLPSFREKNGCPFDSCSGHNSSGLLIDSDHLDSLVKLIRRDHLDSSVNLTRRAHTSTLEQGLASEAVRSHAADRIITQSSTYSIARNAPQASHRLTCGRTRGERWNICARGNASIQGFNGTGHRRSLSAPLDERKPCSSGGWHLFLLYSDS